MDPTYGRGKAGRPSRTYIQQLCEDTGCSPEDLPEAMNDRERWCERVRDIRASSTTWWWWWCRSVNVRTILFQAILFSIRMQFSSILPVERSQSGATTPGQSGPGRDNNKLVLLIPQSSCITGVSPSDCLVSYPGHWLEKFYPSAEMQ